MVLEQLITMVVDNRRVALGLLMLVGVVYYRHALGIGRIFQTWAGRIVFSVAVIGIGIILGVIPGLNVERGMLIVTEVVAAGQELVGDLTGVLVA